MVNKSIKETEKKNIFFFSVRSNFISLMNPKTCIFIRGYRVKIQDLGFMSEIKFDLTRKKIIFFFCFFYAFIYHN